MHELILKDVTVTFGGLTAVDRVSLEVRSGEMVGLIGPNGAGKSTLLNAITGVVSPDNGVLKLDDRDLTSTPQHRLRELGIARTFQHPELFGSLSVEDNVLVATRQESSWFQAFASMVRAPSQRKAEKEGREVVEDLLRRVGAEHWADESAEDIPHGVQRLVAVARSLARGGTKILLLDEPAAGLNSDERKALVSAVVTLQDTYGFGVLLVEHDLGLVLDNCQRVCVMNSGERIAYGPPEDVRSDPAVVESYIGG